MLFNNINTSNNNLNNLYPYVNHTQKALQASPINNYMNFYSIKDDIKSNALN